MQPLLDHRQLVQIGGHQNLGRNVGCLIIELLDERGHDLVLLLILGSRQHKVLAPNQLAPSDEKDLDAGLAVVTGKGDKVVIS